jgi:hypothetical protein
MWNNSYTGPIPVAARSKTQVCGRLIAGIAGSGPLGGYGCPSFGNVVRYRLEVSATGQSLVQSRPTDCGACVCDL